MEYTEGDWKPSKSALGDWAIICGDQLICREVRHFNKDLIAAAPLGDELADFVIKVSATWIDDGLMEIGEGDYIRMKELALKFKAKAEVK